MATTYLGEGAVIDYTNAGAAISSDDIVTFDQGVGVALVDIPTGETGAVRIDGEWELPKVSAAVIDVGEYIMWDNSNGAFDDGNATPAAGDVDNCAVAAAPAGAGVTTVKARLLWGVGVRS